MIKRITLFWILLLAMPFVALAKDFLVVDFGAKGNGVTFPDFSRHFFTL